MLKTRAISQSINKFNDPCTTFKYDQFIFLQDETCLYINAHYLGKEYKTKSKYNSTEILMA